jgi:hypothetical protein
MAWYTGKYMHCKRFKITIGFKNKHKGLNIKPIRGSIHLFFVQ